MDRSLTALSDDAARQTRPVSRDAPPSDNVRLPLSKLFKQFIKDRLFDLCEGLESLSSLIQRHILNMTIADRRAQRHLQIPLQRMDQDLLAMHIRWHGHQVEKSVRHKREPGSKRGKQVAELLRADLNEWSRRGYPSRDFTGWAQENLSDFQRWVETNEPQIHPEQELPVYDQCSPVWEVLTNRVSTRFWQPIPVEDEKVSQILRAATYAPTGCNRQTWKLYVRKTNDLDHNSTSSGVNNQTLMIKAPVAIYITIDNRLYPEIWGPAEDAGILGLQLSLAATSLGLAGCLMYGAEKFDQEKFRKEFDVPSYRFMYLSYLFGYAAERTLTKKRAHPEDVAILV